MTKDELLQVLKDGEDVGDAITQEHQDHNCPVGEAARILRDGCGIAYRVLAAGNGPAQVATDNYRRNWDGIFGAKPSWGQA